MTARSRTNEADTETVGAVPSENLPATVPLETPMVKREQLEYLYFCANPDHPGLAAFSLKDPNHAIERAFYSTEEPNTPNGHAPICPACGMTVAAYAIETEGDIPEAIQKAPY